MNAVRERRPFDELHHQRDSALCFFEAIDGGDVRVVQRRQHLGFAPETRQPIGISGDRRGKNLDRDSPFQPAVGGLIDLAHSADADLANHLVGAEAGTRGEHRGEYTRLQAGRYSPSREKRALLLLAAAQHAGVSLRRDLDLPRRDEDVSLPVWLGAGLDHLVAASVIELQISPAVCRIH